MTQPTQEREDRARHLPSLCDELSHAALLADDDGHYVDVNEAACELTGYSREELLSMGVWDLTPAPNRDVGQALWQAFIAAGEQSGEYTLESKDGKMTEVEYHATANVMPGLHLSVLHDVTDRVRTRVERDRQEESYRALFNSIRDAILVANTERTIVDCNPAFTELFGYTLDEIRGRKTVTVYESEEQYQQLGEELRNNAQDPGFLTQVNYQKKTGEIFVGETNAFYLQDQQGNVTGFVGLIRDITDRVRMEQELRERRQWLAGTLRSIGDGVIATDTAGRVTFMNPVAETLTGWDEADAAGKPVEDVFHIVNERTGEPVPNPTHRVLRQGVVVGLANHTALLAKDGTQRAIADSGAPITDDDGNVIGTVLAFSDVTERREKEQKLRQMSKVFMEAADPIIIEDLDGCVIDMNADVERTYGWTREELIGQPIKKIVPPEGHQQADELLQQCKQGEPVRGVQGSRLTKSGDVIPVLLTLSLLNDEVGDPVAVASMAQDISELKETQKELRLAKEAAEAANRAKSQFLANMSHELRTPLNAVMGYAQLMARDREFPSRHQEKLETIVASGEHLLELINDVLEMSKIEAGQSTLNENEFDLYKMLETLERTFRIRAQKKGLQFRLESGPQVPPFIRADERKLRQVLLNLLSNAVKFTAEGGVTLRIKLKKSSDGETRIAFEVQDTGVGIEPEEREQIFDIFEQSASGRQSQEGTGLGLSISRRFVRLMGGELIFDSQVGEGTVFGFDMPVVEVDASHVEPAEPERLERSLAPDQPAFRILVVEDKKVGRDLLVQLLEMVGFQVRSAADGQEAVELWEAWQPHLIWMDMRMPVMDGYEATRRIRAAEDGDAIPILALTATAFEEDRAEVLAAGCDDFVRKPFRAATIFNKIAEHLGVEYVYEDAASSDDASSAGNAPGASLTPEDLADLSDDWVADLQQAASRGRTGLVRELVEEIDDEYPALAQALEELVNDFRFDDLLRISEGRRG